jgi:antitoxin YefM
MEILADPHARTELQDARDEVTSGEVVRGVDAVRALRPHT